MAWKPTVASDEQADTNLQTVKAFKLRNELLEHYCMFPEAHRILLSFCTYSMLTGSIGRTTVQVPFYRIDFPDASSYWAK